VKATDSEPPLDTTPGQAGIEELLKLDNPALAPSDPGDHVVGVDNSAHARPLEGWAD
jgi:hypothetical protein